MFELTDRRRKIIKVLLILSVVASVYLGLKGVFIDLYNPGSPVARQYSQYVDWIFYSTILLAFPLLLEKYYKAKAWFERITSLPSDERMKEEWRILKPIIVNIAIVVFLALILSILLPMLWQVPPDVLANYITYYNTKYVCYNGVCGKSIQNINITGINNISINLTR